MAEIVVSAKPLTVNPLKTSQPIGASLAFLGLAEAMPLEHGARGCTSFNKLFFMRHFREPIALQTTAMDQLTTILGADGNVVEALATICERDQPQIIGLITTGLSEMQGADMPRTITAFRDTHPEFKSTTIVPVATTDTMGCLETGFALAVEAIIEHLVPEGRARAMRPRQVNVLASASLTPGDIDAVKEWIAAFGLTTVVLPDLGDSLDGHLIERGFSTLTYGGTGRDAIATMNASAATLVIGRSLDRAADKLAARTGIPDFRFPGLMGLAASDTFTEALIQIANGPVPDVIRRQRARLEDAMVDCQFQLGGARAAVAGDGDLITGLADVLTGMGAEVVAAVTPVRAPHLEALPVDTVAVGDLGDLERLAGERGAELIITNAHGAEIARRLGTALLRAGYPIYDTYGAHAEAWIGYGGTRRVLFAVANQLLARYQDIRPYHSMLRPGEEAARC
jgi:nitrogenase molybdenum-iron protein NifN